MKVRDVCLWQEGDVVWVYDGLETKGDAIKKATIEKIMYSLDGGTMNSNPTFMTCYVRYEDGGIGYFNGKFLFQSKEQLIGCMKLHLVKAKDLDAPYEWRADIPNGYQVYAWCGVRKECLSTDERS